MNKYYVLERLLKKKTFSKYQDTATVIGMAILPVAEAFDELKYSQLRNYGKETLVIEQACYKSKDEAINASYKLSTNYDGGFIDVEEVAVEMLEELPITKTDIRACMQMCGLSYPMAALRLLTELRPQLKLKRGSTQNYNNYFIRNATKELSYFATLNSKYLEYFIEAKDGYDVDDISFYFCFDYDYINQKASVDELAKVYNIFNYKRINELFDDCDEEEKEIMAKRYNVIMGVLTANNLSINSFAINNGLFQQEVDSYVKGKKNGKKNVGKKSQDTIYQCLIGLNPDLEKYLKEVK